MKMKAIDQYNSERLVVYQDRNNSNRTLDMFQFFMAFLRVKVSNTVQSRCLNTHSVYLKENLLAHYFQVFSGHHLFLFLADSVIAQLLSLKPHSFMAPLIF